MRDNDVQFAVVREYPMLEAELVRLTQASNVLLIASGGCTALTLQALFPDLHITLVDFNPAQLERVQEKMRALRETDTATRHRRFNIGTNDPNGLNQNGNFESLFRGLREFVKDFTRRGNVASIAMYAGPIHGHHNSIEGSDANKPLFAYHGTMPYGVAGFSISDCGLRERNALSVG